MWEPSSFALPQCGRAKRTADDISPRVPEYRYLQWGHVLRGSLLHATGPHSSTGSEPLFHDSTRRSHFAALQQSHPRTLIPPSERDK